MPVNFLTKLANQIIKVPTVTKAKKGRKNQYGLHAALKSGSNKSISNVSRDIQSRGERERKQHISIGSSHMHDSFNFFFSSPPPPSHLSREFLNNNNIIQRVKAIKNERKKMRKSLCHCTAL